MYSLCPKNIIQILSKKNIVIVALEIIFFNAIHLLKIQLHV